MQRSPVRHQRRGYTRRDGVRVRSTSVGSGATAGGVVVLAIVGAVYLNRTPAEDPGSTREDTPTRASTSAPARVTADAPKPRQQRVTVVRELDGDTLQVKQADKKPYRVRIIGIDAPEIAHDGRPTECGADSARDRLRPLRGQSVTLVPDPSQAATDRYGRALAYVQHAKTDVGRDQIAAGAAWEYTYRSTAYARQRDYRAAQSAAERAERGMWDTC